MRVLAKIIALLLLSFAPGVTVSVEYDLIIRNGRVVDGTGNPAFFADIAIREGRIAAIGKVAGDAKRSIDATGLVVAPGFIDVHTHADELDGSPAAENFIRMGVTTLVAGNCGDSTLEPGRFFAALERTNLAVNAATLLGHGSVRRRAMGGSFNRAPTAEELGRMRDMVDNGMKQGAIGLSTGLIYAPGVFATTEELVEVTKAIAPHQGIYASHMRHEDKEVFSALDEAFRIAREAGVRAEVSHIKLVGPSAWGQANLVLAAIEKARASGLDITQDQYSYTASSTSLSQLIPDHALEGGRQKFAQRLEEPSERAKIVSWMKENLRGKGRADYEYAVVASCKHDRSLNGMNIAEIARARRGSDSVEHQIDVILEIQKNGGASGVFHGINEEDLRVFLRHPNTMVACDSGLRVFGEGVPHPRGYGNNARVLARYVRELKVLALEDALRKMTSLPANTFHLQDRGLLRVGNWADLTLFHPEQVADTATFGDPHHYAVGIPWVIVNGIVVLENSTHTHAKAGVPLRHICTDACKR